MMIVAGPAYFSYFWCQQTDVVTVLAYFNYSQYQTTKDTGIITRYHVLRNTKGTKSDALTDRMKKKMAKTKIDVTLTDLLNANLRIQF